jgi:hypothetical protein
VQKCKKTALPSPATVRVQVTARLIEGVEVVHTEFIFTVGFVTAVPFFKVQETTR